MANAIAKPNVQPAEVVSQLEKVLRSTIFESSERSSKVLRFLVEQALAGNGDQLKEYTIGVEALGRPESFDPRIDSIARVEVSRLRTRLQHYYATDGKEDLIIFVLPRGGYLPKFESRTPASNPIPASTVSSSRLVLLGLAAAVLVLGALILIWRPWRSPEVLSRQPLEVDLALPAGVGLANVVGIQVALSPDATNLIFVAARASGGSELWLRKLDRREIKPLPGTEGGRGPFFSPDGEWVAFWAGGKLKKIAVRGGSPTVLCDAPDLLGGSWGDDGQIVAAITSEARLWRIPANGGAPSTIVDLTPNPFRLVWPQVLPGSRMIVFSNIGSTADSGSVEMFSTDSGSRKVLVRGGTFGRYLPSGHLVYVNQGTLYAQKFRKESFESKGNPVAIIAGVSESPVFGFAQLDFSANGMLVYRRQTAGERSTLNWVAQDGKINRVIPDIGSYLAPRVSPDGREAAYAAMVSGESRVWVKRPGGTAPVALTPDGQHYSTPLWTPDGRFLVVQGRNTLEWMSYPRAGSPKVLLKGGLFVPWSFSPDGRRLAFHRMDATTHFDLWTVPLEVRGSDLYAGNPEPFLRTKTVETYPAFSPDGKWIAYVSLQSGAYEVYVRAFPDNGAEVQISRGGGRLPIWNRRGNEILYETEDHRIMSVPWRVRSGVFESGEPRPWSGVKLAETGVLANLDLAVDGRMLALLPGSGDGEPREMLSMTLNFFQELENRLGR